MGVNKTRSYSGIREWKNRRIRFDAVFSKPELLEGLAVTILTGGDLSIVVPLGSSAVRELHEYLDMYGVDSFKMSTGGGSFVTYQEDNGTTFFRSVDLGASVLIAIDDTDTENLYDWLTEILQADQS